MYMYFANWLSHTVFCHFELEQHKKKSISCSLLKETNRLFRVSYVRFYSSSLQSCRYSRQMCVFSSACHRWHGLKGWKAFGTLVLCNRNISSYLHMNHALLQLFHQAKSDIAIFVLVRRGFSAKALLLEWHFPSRPRVSIFFPFFFTALN